MSKEMMVIALGLWIIVVRTLLGLPGSWQTVLFVLTGVLLAVIGFLLRGEALSRAASHRARHSESAAYPFVDNAASAPAAGRTPMGETHEHKEGITSLN